MLHLKEILKKDLGFIFYLHLPINNSDKQNIFSIVSPLFSRLSQLLEIYLSLGCKLYKLIYKYFDFQKNSLKRFTNLPYID